MSIQDRIKFFQQLNKPKQPEIKPLPTKTVNKLFMNKMQLPKPISDQKIQSSSQNLHQQNNIKQPSKLAVNESPKQLYSKSEEIIVQVPSQKLPSPQKVQNQGVQRIGKLKDLINKHEMLKQPVIKQVGVASCFVPQTKKIFSPVQKQKSQNNDDKIPNRVFQPPKFEVQTDGQKKLSFQDLVKIAALTVTKSQMGFPKIAQKQQENHHQTSQDNHVSEQKLQNNQQNDGKINIHLEQQSQKLQEQGSNNHQKSTNGESDKLFHEALKQQAQIPTQLVTGLSSNLNLATRRTIAKRKNDSDDFDDL